MITANPSSPLQVADRLQRAIDLVKIHKFSQRKAAKTAGVSRAALQRRLNGMDVAAKRGRPTILTPQEEKSIVDSLIFLAHRGVPLTRKMLKNESCPDRFRWQICFLQ